MNESKRTLKSWFYFALFLVLLSFPILSVFNRGKFLGTFPVSFVYLFFIWSIIIVAIFILNDMKVKNSDKK